MNAVRVVDADRSPQPPIGLEEAKLFLRVDHAEEDPVIAGLVAAAVDYAEVATRRAIALGLWELSLRSFPCGTGRIELPNPPVREVVSIEYRDDTGAWASLAAAEYELEQDGDLYYARLPEDGSWPTAPVRDRAVRIRYRAGYGAQDLPAQVRTAILVHANAHFVRRDNAEIPAAVDRLLFPYRVDL